MSVASVGLDTSQSVRSSSVRSSIHQARQDFDQLYQALQSGNLGAAQQAYTSFQQVQAGLTSSSATAATSATATTTSNPIAADWSALGQTLQSGSLSSAQDALSKLGQDAQTAWQTHVQQETQNAESVYALMQSTQGTTATAAVTPTATSSSTQAATGSVQNDLNALNQTLQSGDTTAAQKLLAQLVQDLQASNQASGQGSGGHHHHHHGGLAGTNTASSAYGSTAAATPTSSTSTGTTAGTSSNATGTV